MRFQYPLLRIPNGFIKTDMLDDEAVSVRKIAQSLASDNYVAGATGWHLTRAGNAEFNDVTIRGIIAAATGSSLPANIVGASQVADHVLSALKFASTLQSDNYSAGGAGWQITRDTGNAEFNDVTVRGKVVANSLSTLPAGAISAGTITATIEMIAATITGGILRTAASGHRIVIGDYVDEISFYSGNADETTRGQIRVGSDGDMAIVAPTLSSGPTVLTLTADELVAPPALPTDATLAGAWTEVHSTFYTKTAERLVMLNGTVTGGAYPSTVFTLPAGFRPPAFRRFAVASATASGTGYIDIDTAGNVIASAGSGYICLDGVTFNTFGSSSPP